MGKDPNEIRQEIEATRERMGETIGAIGYKADVPARVQDSVGERLGAVRGGVVNAVESVKSTFAGTVQTVGAAGSAIGQQGSTMGTNISSSARDSVSEAGARAVRVGGLLQQNPLGLTLGAFAVGLIGGLLIPVTDIEREKVGPLRDQVADRAQAMSSDIVEHGKAVVQDTVNAAVASGQDHAQQVAEAAKSSASA